MTNPEVVNLRPKTWDQFIGQTHLKHILDVHIEAAIQHQRPLDPILFIGPPGFGKTSLATIIGHKCQAQVTMLTMPLTERALLNALRNFEGGILFLDEIHTLTRSRQEQLLTVVSESYVQDNRGRITLIPELTIIGATTERGKIIAPLLDRFPIRPDFIDYTDEELAQIVLGMAENVGVPISHDIAIVLGQAAGGVPRNALRLVFAARDIDAVGETLTTERILTFCRVDHDGLTANHVRYLQTIRGLGGTAGQKTLELTLGHPATTLLQLERLLLQKSLIEYTPSGRELTAGGISRAKDSHDKSSNRP